MCDRALCIERLTERVDDTAQEPLAHRNLEELSRRPDFVAFLQLGVVAEDDHADLGLVEIQRQAGNAATKVEHLVQHDVGKPLHARDTVANLANHANALFDHRGLDARDRRFDFF